MNIPRITLLVVLAVASLQLGSMALLRTPTASALTNCTVNDLSIDGEEQAFLDAQINPYRASVGLPPLKMAVELNRAASWMAIDLSTHTSFSHTDSLGRDPFVRMTQCDAPAGSQAENIAGGYDTAASVFQAWRNSPGHDTNMRGPYTYIGIARACCGAYGWYWVTTFSSTGTPLTGGGGGTGGGLLAPSNVAVSGATASSLNVTFNDNATTESSMQYERKTGTAGTYALVYEGGALSGAQAGWYWPNQGLSSATTYCYRIRARGTTAYSAYSNEACGTTTGSAGLPAPSALTLAGTTASSLAFTFNDNATTEYSMQYERKTGTGGTYAMVFEGGALPGAQSGWYWPNEGLSPSTVYCYRIRARGTAAYSAYSNEVCGTTQTGSALGAPTSVFVAVRSRTALDVQFKDNATTETGIDIERRAGQTGAWTVVKTTTPLSGAQAGWYWPDSGLSPGTQYCYRLIARNGQTASAYSAIACGTTSP